MNDPQRTAEHGFMPNVANPSVDQVSKTPNATASDQHPASRANSQADAGASVDRLTGLPDMNAFHQLAREAAAEITARGERPAAIALDLIGLKAFNTQYGRDQGDVLLCVFADVLRTHLGEQSCSRFAEDHFYAFAAEKDVEPKLNALFEDFKHANNARVLPVRAGVYVCHEGEDIAAMGTDRAKLACDLDRKTWESHVMYFSDDMRQAEKLRIHVLENVDRAVAEGWVRPYYQPVVRAATSELCGEEALARWVDPEFGMLSPAQFIPVLEEAGILYKIDFHIVDCVIADLLEKISRDVHIAAVSMNFSQHDFRDFDLAETLSEKADAAGLPRNLLAVEVIESVASADPERFKTQVRALHEAGFEVWMDDFGSGYSSLNTLQDYNFDVLKLDMSFTSALEANEKAREIVTGIVETAERMNVVTLAEGVETREQAEFLESIGCVMLQGYYFSSPQPLDIIIARFEKGIGIPREAPDENIYWNVVGTTSLVDLSSTIDTAIVEGTPLDDFPVGVIEHRGDTWRMLRANKPYRELLDQLGILEPGHSPLRASVVASGLDDDFLDAINRCEQSREWEVIAGRLDYGTGYQTYVRPIITSPRAEAYHIAAFPTMLGSTLGSYGDVPMAYAVFRVMLNEQKDGLDDMEYVYANEMFCEWGSFDQETLPGTSFLSSWENASDVWFPYCYRAAVLGETVHDILYSPETEHWLSFNVAPSPVKNCCVYAFSIVDEERRRRDEIIAHGDTSDLIIEVMNELSHESSYDATMNGVLAILSKAIHADRLFILEQRQRLDSKVFERCAEGVNPRMEALKRIDDEKLSAFVDKFRGRGVIFAETLEDLGIDDENAINFMRSQGVASLITVPLRENGRFVGCLGADNYALEEGLDIERLLETIAPAMATAIANNKLVEELEWTGLHDELTELYNRRGIDAAIAEHLEGHPDDPFVLALIDIDDFKRTNDLHGHAAGDQALKALSNEMTRLFPTDAFIGRNGGDELLAMLVGENTGRADEVFAQFGLNGLCYPFEGKRLRLTTSIGYTDYPGSAKTLKQAYSQADAALYAVKLAGKSGARHYSVDLNSQYRSQLGFTPRDIAENIPGAVMVHRAGGDGEILFANEDMIRLMGCKDFADFMDYTKGCFRYIVHPDDGVSVYEDVTSQVSLDDLGKKIVLDYRIIAKDGTVKNIAENGQLVEAESIGKVFYALVIDRDEHDSRYTRNRD